MGVSPKVRAEMFVRNQLKGLGLTAEAKRRIIGDLALAFNQVAADKDRVWTEMLKASGVTNGDLLTAGNGR